jgi:FkbM family methyltransferase
MRQAIKNAFRVLGYNVTRWDRFPFMPHIRSLGIDLILDVGANTGQYARLVRASGYAGKIISFEPVQSAYAELEKFAAYDSLWTCCCLAMGSTSGEAMINVGQGSNMSSFRVIHSEHAERHDFARIIGTQLVTMRTLDDVFEAYARGSHHVLLKMDVQGYEDEVLKGASASLNKIDAIQTEMSIVPTYSNQKEICASIADLNVAGFDLFDINNGFRESNYRLLEVDGFFVRRGRRVP